MRVYSRVVVDIETGVVVDAEAREYSGPVALCKGPKLKQVKLPEPAPPPPLPPPPKLDETEEERRAAFFRTMMNYMRKGKAGSLIGTGAGVKSPTSLGVADISGGRKTILGA